MGKWYFQVIILHFSSNCSFLLILYTSKYCSLDWSSEYEPLCPCAECWKLCRSIGKDSRSKWQSGTVEAGIVSKNGLPLFYHITAQILHDSNFIHHKRCSRSLNSRSMNSLQLQICELLIICITLFTRVVEKLSMSNLNE